MTCVSGIRHFCPRNCLMYVQKTFQCGDFLPFSSLEFSQWMLRMKSVALNISISFTLLPSAPSELVPTGSCCFSSCSEKPESLSLLPVYRREQFFPLGTSNFDSREDNEGTEGKREQG